MWKNQRVSVVFSTYNEKESIKDSINEFFDSGYVDEVIVVNNNAADGTDEEVKKTKAKLFHEKKQGYGYGYQRALKEAAGDIIIMSEPDGTFVGNDVLKLLAYSDDFDAVFGTRTSSSLIGHGANMGLFLKYGNFFVAKFIEILFNTTQLTDAGCTMRLIKRKVYEKIKDKFRVGKSHFGPEMMMLIILNKTKFIEIPLNYRKRIGKSSVTGSFWKAFKLGWVMIGLVLKYRMKRIWEV
ncbi:glycosyltransferase family 2 protein [Candidatus Woesearchaeota archaeon]|nr:glycosyltransferase family 2 protein [Candidatus Woesearchaeota archaeon]